MGGIAPVQAVFAAIRFPAVGFSAADQAAASGYYGRFPAVWPPHLFFGTLLFRVVAAILPLYSDCGRMRQLGQSARMRLEQRIQLSWSYLFKSMPTFLDTDSPASFS